MAAHTKRVSRALLAGKRLIEGDANLEKGSYTWDHIHVHTEGGVYSTCF